MNRAVVSLLVMTLLILFVVSPFSALAMLMMFLLVAGIAGTINSMVHLVVHHNPPERSDS
ncbi:hypothetical protein [Leptolyngbya sp. FACHB-17]|uniref:hypothetical protein n=1 Tax=unclassified Leptolyngbya TaxID=2650499 RepID=UPI00168180E7|nr:hypothetical protein [Leptolyngbya sp. FACHB-17]MBD2082370.1 hypothetical protein [Leptolyngbya sp. FACHB-17]